MLSEKGGSAAPLLPLQRGGGGAEFDVYGAPPATEPQKSRCKNLHKDIFICTTDSKIL
jgi:hypothetical protein